MNDIGLLIKKISNKLECRRNRCLKEFGLTGTQMDLLVYLYSHQERENTLSDIAAFFDIQHTSVIHVLKILEEKDYITKIPTKRNPRFKNICLTDKSFTIMKQIHSDIAAVHEQMVQGLSPKDQEELVGLLNQIYGNVENLKYETKDNTSDIMKNTTKEK